MHWEMETGNDDARFDHGARPEHRPAVAGGPDRLVVDGDAGRETAHAADLVLVDGETLLMFSQPKTGKVRNLGPIRR